MTSALLQFVALATSFVLALPPGSCSLFVPRHHAEPKPAPVTCCQQANHEHSSRDKQSPAPVVECCCQWEATLPEKAVPPADVSVSLLPLAADAASDVGSSFEVRHSLFWPSAPPLRVLQCVWTC